MGTQGMIETTLNITAGSEGGPVVWKVEEVVKPYSQVVCTRRGGREGSKMWRVQREGRDGWV